MKNISILGSTGSIGTQTLDVVRRSKNLKVCGITANKNIKLLEQQIRQFRPEKAAVADKSLYNELKNNVSDTETKILCGEDGLLEIASMDDVETVVSALVGISGLKPTLAAVENGKEIALANKETLVTAGEFFMNKIKEYNVKILPVDSEHSAIFQCLDARGAEKFIKKILLTCSGGPFFGKKREELTNMTAKDALKHPNWSMGSKITIDSSTLMNKGFEIIEAKWLFDVDVEDIEVIVHRQSIIHSMVHFSDNSVIAQLGLPDMKVPISYALNYPEREKVDENGINFFDCPSLTFEHPDEKTFKCLYLAKEAIRTGGTMPAFLNGANEVVVEKFLNGEIKFNEIGDLIEEAMNGYTPVYNYCLEDITNADITARNSVNSLIGGK
ncbi:MAG: 1-deoxy-D-xylulose-5-phosphate reductoisomerase [Clostridia bacterium]|nr:1-deoxy-D-xylulose-5-phosphate reductoisomerase [Clostridia bacterium]